MCAVLLPALDDEAAFADNIKFEEMDGGTVHVSMLAAVGPLCTSSAIGVLPALSRPPSSKTYARGRGGNAAIAVVEKPRRRGKGSEGGDSI
jgi:hypothetical protein